MDEQCRHLKSWMLDKGLLIRPLGSTIYLMPPYCTPIHELARAYEKIAEYIVELKQQQQ
jgi:adenosylmethionine-8-amino-7-oxononanoate aminotransferase